MRLLGFFSLKGREVAPGPWSEGLGWLMLRGEPVAQSHQGQEKALLT